MLFRNITILIFNVSRMLFENYYIKVSYGFLTLRLFDGFKFFKELPRREEGNFLKILLLQILYQNLRYFLAYLNCIYDNNSNNN